MAKRFKLKLSRVISSFQSCRSKDTSTLPSNPVPSFLRLSPVKPNLPTTSITLHLPARRPPPRSSSKPHHSSSLMRHVSSAFTSIGCGFRSKPSSYYLSTPDHSKPSPNFHWKKEDNWHVVAKVYDEIPRQKIYTSSSTSSKSKNSTKTTKNDTVSLPPKTVRRTTKRRQKRNKTTTSRLRFSISSADDTLCFTSEGLDGATDEEETGALVVSSSRRSLSSTDSSNFRKKKANNKRPKRRRRCGGGVARDYYGERSEQSSSPARLSRFQWMIPCTVDGKVRESFAVVKRSEDPREDFKRSMMEMIRENEMFDVKDLEQLLHCFLSLNSRDHHGVIVHTFSEIWDTLLARNVI